MTDLAAIPASREAGTGARRLHDVLSGRLLPSVLFVAIASCGGRVSGVGQGAEASGDASTAQDVDASSEGNGDASDGSFVLCSQEYGVVDSCDAGGIVERCTAKVPSCRSGQGLGSSAPDGAIELGWICCESDGVVCALSFDTACQ